MATAPLDEIGRSGLAVHAGQVSDEHLRALQGDRWRRIVPQMLDYPVISGAQLTIETLCRSVEWRVDPVSDDPRAVELAEFCSTCLHDMEASWPDTLSTILSALPWGWSYLETVYKLRQGDRADPARHSQYDDGRVGLRKLALRAQESLDHWGYDDQHHLTGMYQRPAPDYVERFIPLDRALHFRTSVAKDSPEGRSILRGVYLAWYFATSLAKLEAIGIERDLTGLPVGWAPPEVANAAPDSPEATIKAEFEAILARLRNDEQAYLLLPLAYDPETKQKLYDFQLQASPGQRQHNVRATIQDYKAEILMGMLTDWMMLGHEKTGSWALASDKTEQFAVALGAWLDAVAGAINTQVFPRLVRFNGWPTALTPTLCHGDIESLPLNTLADFFDKLTQVGLITPTPELEAWLLRQAGAPVPQVDTGTVE